jgi:hypothetical protein
MPLTSSGRRRATAELVGTALLLAIVVGSGIMGDGADMTEPVRILFLCTGNSARSQMAEGLARALCGGRVHAFSAGTEPKPVHPLAVEAMSEIGCPVWPRAAEQLRWSFDDPAAAAGESRGPAAGLPQRARRDPRAALRPVRRPRPRGAAAALSAGAISAGTRPARGALRWSRLRRR